MKRRTFLASITAAGAATTLGGPWASWLQAAAAAGPDEVFIIRHAEEPLNGPNLNDRGRERANALSKLFDNKRFARPTAIFAAKSTPESSRPVETVQPLAAALGLTINDDFKETRYESLSQLVLHGAAYDHGHVLICWHQGSIPELARTLGATKVPNWPKTVYDGIWVLKFAGGKPTLTPEAQHLLGGDRIAWNG